MRLFALALYLCAVSLCAATACAAEFRTDNEGAPRISHVKLLYSVELREYWAWVTIEHEDWPIETRRFKLPDNVLYPDLPDLPGKQHWRVEGYQWRDIYNREDEDRVYERGRQFPAPYRHSVDWWAVVGPKGEKVHKRFIEKPHPGGWPFKLLERGIKVPNGMSQLTFKAHDPVHGYGPPVVIDLLKNKGTSYEIEPLPPFKWTGRIPSVRKWMRSNSAFDIPDLW